MSDDAALVEGKFRVAKDEDEDDEAHSEEDEEEEDNEPRRRISFDNWDGA
jgi:hypothetical protein